MKILSYVAFSSCYDQNSYWQSGNKSFVFFSDCQKNITYQLILLLPLWWIPPFVFPLRWDNPFLYLAVLPDLLVAFDLMR